MNRDVIPADHVEEFLDNDPPILGQNYVCLSFVSPEKFIKQKEVYTFHRYMTDKFREYNEMINVLSKKHLKLDDIENITEEEANTDVNKKLVKELKERAASVQLQLINSKEITKILCIGRGKGKQRF